MEFTREYFVPKINNIKNKCLYTNVELCKIMGISYLTLSNIMNGNGAIKIFTLKKIRDFINKHEDKDVKNVK